MDELSTEVVFLAMLNCTVLITCDHYLPVTERDEGPQLI